VLCGYDSGLCADVMKSFEQEVSRSLRHRAKEQLGLGSVKEAHTGSVLFIQRFDSARAPSVARRRVRARGGRRALLPRAARVDCRRPIFTELLLAPRFVEAHSLRV
jgi:hypothetical protein